MHNPDSIQENDTHKLHWDFEMQLDHLILTRQPDHSKQKKHLPNSGLCRPGWPLSKMGKKKKKNR